MACKLLWTTWSARLVLEQQQQGRLLAGLDRNPQALTYLASPAAVATKWLKLLLLEALSKHLGSMTGRLTPQAS
jgi:hypothetical protein